jgi:hypothetical protein
MRTDDSKVFQRSGATRHALASHSLFKEYRLNRTDIPFKSHKKTAFTCAARQVLFDFPLPCLHLPNITSPTQTLSQHYFSQHYFSQWIVRFQIVSYLQGKEHNFEKYSHGQIDTLGSAYDYDSIMHYGRYGFSANGQATLLAIGDSSRTLGQREGLSPGDILKLNTLYDCSSKSSFLLHLTFLFFLNQLICLVSKKLGTNPGTGIPN